MPECLLPVTYEAEGLANGISYDKEKNKIRISRETARAGIYQISIVGTLRGKNITMIKKETFELQINRKEDDMSNVDNGNKTTWKCPLTPARPCLGTPLGTRSQKHRAIFDVGKPVHTTNTHVRTTGVTRCEELNRGPSLPMCLLVDLVNLFIL